MGGNAPEHVALVHGLADGGFNGSGRGVYPFRRRVHSTGSHLQFVVVERIGGLSKGCNLLHFAPELVRTPGKEAVEVVGTQWRVRPSRQMMRTKQLDERSGA